VHRTLLAILGFIAAIFFILFVCYNISYEKKLTAIQDDIKIRAIVSPTNNESEVVKLKKDNVILQENINSLNTRFNDLYLLGATIVVLLLAITASVYLKTEVEVDKHFKDNFDRNIKKIEEYENKALTLVGRLETIERNISAKQSLSSTPEPPPQ
jgi:hypothetical protein